MEHRIGEWAQWLLGAGGSLLGIRLAMACLAVGYAIQFAKGVRNTPAMAVLWGFGALFASFHTATAISAFHSGNFSEALESTASRTEAMFGVRVGWGLYVNYAFVAVWWLDAIWRWRCRTDRLRLIEIGFDFFLISIAFFGAIVFATGPIRYVGLASIAVWVFLWFRRFSKNRVATERAILW